MRRVRGASGDALARGPAFPPISAPARPPRPLFSPLPQHGPVEGPSRARPYAPYGDGIPCVVTQGEKHGG